MTDFKIKNKAFLEPFYAWMNKVSLEMRKPLCGLEMWQIEQLCYVLPIIINPF